MKLWKAIASIIPALSLVSCGPPQALDVRPMHIRSVTIDDSGDPMVRGELKRRFHGAVSVEEQGQRLGYYYTVLWNEDSGSGPGEVVFEYQQGATGSRVKKMTHKIEAGETKGKAEFAIIGENYRPKGEASAILAWRCKLYREGREVASRQSYLWQ